MTGHDARCDACMDSFHGYAHPHRTKAVNCHVLSHKCIPESSGGNCLYTRLYQIAETVQIL